MIIPVEMYQCVCDGCGKSYYDDFNGFVAWSDEITAQNAATENGWHEIDGRHYCPDCVEYDEELDDWVPKKRPEDKEESK